jgi:DNA-binding MarR family transcriptional regulator
VDQPPDVIPEQALQRVGWALRRADLMLQSAKEPALRAVGLSTASYSLLMHVHVYPGLNGAELGRRLGVSTQAVALLATKLEAGGLVERRAHPRHRNIQELYLTDEGDRTLQAAYQHVGRIEDRLTDRLGPEDAQRLRGLLDTVMDVLADTE